MQNVTNFWLWFLQTLPSFLMSEPIVYFLGLAILICVVRLFGYMKSI